MFERAECSKPVIVLHEVRGRVFEALLEYMYTGQSQVDFADMPEVLRQARSLSIRWEVCWDFLLHKDSNVDVSFS